MDFTKFSDENFDLKNWINAVFITQKDTNQNAEVNISNFSYINKFIYIILIFINL